MTTEEVHHEMCCDFMCVHRKAISLDKIVFAEMKRKHLEHEVRYVKYLSARKTEWTIVYRITNQLISHLYYTEANDKRGKVAYQFIFDSKWNTKGILKYTTHFFQRYRERQQPHLNNPTEIIRHFFKHNIDCKIGEKEKQEDGTHIVNYVLTEGVGMGWFNLENKTGHVKTYLPHHLLNGKQQSHADRIINNGDAEEFRIIKQPKPVE